MLHPMLGVAVVGPYLCVISLSFTLFVLQVPATSHPYPPNHFITNSPNAGSVLQVDKLFIFTSSPLLHALSFLRASGDVGRPFSLLTLATVDGRVMLFSLPVLLKLNGEWRGMGKVSVSSRFSTPSQPSYSYDRVLPLHFGRLILFTV